MTDITIQDILFNTIQIFRTAGIINSGGNAETLLGSVMNMNRTELFMNHSRSVSEENRAAFERLVERRLDGEPLQYIIGEMEFFSLPLKIDRRALIPRPETETLVEIALKHLDSIHLPKILDIGTGSGAIAVAIASKIDCSVTGIDISPDALELARENAVLNNVSTRIRFLNADLLADDFPKIVGNSYDVAVSNPPYIARNEVNMLDSEIRDYEPMIALTDGGDGLEFYRRISEILPSVMKPGCRVFIEIAESRAEEVEAIMQPVLTGIEIIPDLAHRFRVLSGKCSLE